MPQLIEDVRQVAEKLAGRPQVHAGRARLGRQRRVGLRDVPPRHAGAADHRQRRAPVHLRARAAREPGAALRQQLLLRVQQVPRAGRAAETRTIRRKARRAARTPALSPRRSRRDAIPRKTGRPGSRRGRSPDRRRPASITTAPIIATRRSTTCIRVDDSDVVVRSRGDRGRQVDDHQRPDVRDLGLPTPRFSRVISAASRNGCPICASGCTRKTITG